MKMFNTTLIAAAAIAVVGGAAQADLNGTTLDLEINHSGFLGNMVGPTGGTHTYGTTETFTGNGAGSRTWDATSPAPHPDYDNSILINYANFDLNAFYSLGPCTATLDITNIADEVAAATVDVFLATDLNTSIALSAGETIDSITTSWDAETVYDSNPSAPSVVVAWNSVTVPTPGTAVLLGLAGVTSIRRRRRTS